MSHESGSSAFLNSQLLSQYDDAVKAVLLKAIKEAEPLAIFQYPQGWDVLYTSVEPQFLVVTKDGFPKEKRFEIYDFWVATAGQKMSWEWITESRFYEAMEKMNSMIVPSILNGLLLYIKNPGVYGHAVSILSQKANPTIAIGDSLNADSWIEYAEYWYRIAHRTLMEHQYDLAAYMFHLSAEIALKGLYLKNTGQTIDSHDFEYIARSLLLPSDISRHIETLNKLPDLVIRRYPQDDMAISYDMAVDIQTATRAIVEHCAREVRGRSARLVEPNTPPA